MKFFKWLYASFTAECKEGATEMWYDATPSERIELQRYWKANPVCIGKF